MDGLVFDFDGVLVDSEPVHLKAFQHVLVPLGVTLTKEDYYGKYLGFDDRQCLITVLQDNGVASTGRQIADLVAAKTVIVKQALSESPDPLPGVIELIASGAAAGVPVAICSSALRAEIELVARAIGVMDHFTAIVAAEDVSRSKPDPTCYRLTLQQLSEAGGRPLNPGRCVAVEDSPFGVAAAQGAGMKALAITSSYPPQALRAADRVVESLEDVTLQELSAIAART